MSTITIPENQTVRTVPESAPARRSVLADIGNVFVRELRPLLRNPFQVMISLLQPLFFLALFAPLLPTDNALQWFVPGMIVMSALMGASMTGSNLMLEMMTGSHERLLVSPLSRPALMVGRALKEIAPVFLQSAIILAIVTPFSFDLHLGGVLLGLAILAVFTVGIGALSFALGLASEGQDWLFWTVQQTLIFPLLLLAGVMLPLDGAPGWLQTLSEINPMTHVVDAERALFNGEFPLDTILAGAGSAVGVALVGLAIGIRSMRRS